MPARPPAAASSACTPALVPLHRVWLHDEVTSLYHQEYIRSTRALSIRHGVDRLALARQQRLKSLHESPIVAMSLSTRSMLATLSVQGLLSVHDTTQPSSPSARLVPLHSAAVRRPGSAHGSTGRLTDVQWYPMDSGLLTTIGADGRMVVWDASTLSPAYCFDPMTGYTQEDESNQVVSLYSHRYSSIASTHALAAVATSDPWVVLYDLRSGANTHQLKGHISGPVYSVAWSFFSEYELFSAGQDGTLLAWDIRRPGPCRYFSDPGAASTPLLSAPPLYKDRTSARAAQGLVKPALASSSPIRLLCASSFQPCLLYSYGEDRHLKAWHTGTGAFIASLCIAPAGGSFQPRTRTWPSSMCLIEPERLVLPDGHQVSITDLDAWTKRTSLHGHLAPVSSVAWDAISATLFSAGHDAQIVEYTAVG